MTPQQILLQARAGEFFLANPGASLRQAQKYLVDNYGRGMRHETLSKIRASIAAESRRFDAAGQQPAEVEIDWSKLDSVEESARSALLRSLREVEPQSHKPPLGTRANAQPSLGYVAAVALLALATLAVVFNTISWLTSP